MIVKAWCKNCQAVEEHRYDDDSVEVVCNACHWVAITFHEDVLITKKLDLAKTAADFEKLTGYEPSKISMGVTAEKLYGKDPTVVAIREREKEARLKMRDQQLLDEVKRHIRNADAECAASNAALYSLIDAVNHLWLLLQKREDMIDKELRDSI